MPIRNSDGFYSGKNQMENEQTNPTDTTGTPDNPTTENVDTPENTDKTPTSLYDKTEAIVTRQEKANEKTEELLKRQETLFANQRLAGTTGGNVDTKPVEENPHEYHERVKKEMKEGKYDKG